MLNATVKFGARVLVVEDDPSMRMALVRLIKMCGHESFAAATITEGLTSLRCNPTHIFLDMNLPDGEGTAVLWEIRARKMDAKVAFLTGTDDESLLAEAASLLPDMIFKKPTSAGILMDWMS